jgi:hypothetical protein
MQILKSKRWALAVLLLVFSVTTVHAAANNRTTRKYVRYYQAISRSNTNISFVEQVVYTLFFAEAGNCPSSQKPKGLRPS